MGRQDVIIGQPCAVCLSVCLSVCLAGWLALRVHITCRCGAWLGRLAWLDGLQIVMPSSPRAAKGLLLAAIRDPDPGPWCLRTLVHLCHRRATHCGDRACCLRL
jgi:hypothetical protein